MDITLENIQEAIATNPDLGGQLFDSLASTDVGKKKIENSNKVFWDNNINERVGEIHGRYDQDILEVLGEEFKKPDGVKTYSHLKENVYPRMKQLLESGGNSDEVAKLNAKIKELEESGDGGYKKLYEETQMSYEADTTRLKDELSSLRSGMEMDKVRGDLKQGFMSLEYSKDFPAEVINELISVKMAKYIENADITSEGITYKDAEGKIVQGADMGVATAKDIAQKEMSKFLSSGTQGGGGAAKQTGLRNENVGDGKSQERLVLDPTRIGSKSDFIQEVAKVLKELGVDKTSSRAKELQDAAAKEYGYDKLPRV